MIDNVEKRDKRIVPFNIKRITTAIKKAFIASNTAIDDDDENFITKLATKVIEKIPTSQVDLESTASVEDIQNAVEQVLMICGKYNAAKEYVLYRSNRSKLREKLEGKKIRLTDGSLTDLDTKLYDQFTQNLIQNCKELGLEYDLILNEFLQNLPNSVSIKEAYNALLMAVRIQFELEPDYSFIASRLLQEILHLEVNTLFPIDNNYFQSYVNFGIDKGFLDPKLATFDLDKLSKALVHKRDLQFKYLGMQTLYDRYLLHWQGTRFELPQALFMRVAMGLALNEDDKELRAIEFYDELSQFNLMTSTPTLFNAGTVRPQLSSCYVSTVHDSAEGITKTIADNALLSKYAGGIGNDWSQIRGMGAHINGTNGKSNGVIPFMKMAESGLIAFNQGGKRRGSGCAYLPTWHIDIEEFLELRKNTGDHRRRTHDMNTSNWIHDVFMKRVIEESHWTLFSPDETPLLHSSYGKKFESHYIEYERLADAGEIKLFKRISAVELWRKMLTMLFETGHPWICWSEPSNIRNPQQHVGMVHSSNLCCIAGDQRVVTDKGLLTVKELYDIGCDNKVLGLDGVYNASKMLLPRPNAPMVKIHTKEGYSHKVTPDHKVWVKDKGWLEAQYLVEGDKLLIQQSVGIFGNYFNPDQAYIYGSVTNIRVDKVPKMIWQSDKKTVMQYLRGIFHRYIMENSIVESDVFSINMSIDSNFISVEPIILQELQILLLNIGIKSTITASGDKYILANNNGNIIGYRRPYCLSIHYDDLNFILGMTKDKHDSEMNCTFSHLETLSNEDAYCLTVDSDTHAWTVNGFITKNTEITLNTDEENTAVCNLLSVNLANHIINGEIDRDKLANTVKTGMRMLDNVIDINYYPIPEARNSNLKHRPVGLGLMGLQDALYLQKIPFDSQEAVEFSDKLMELISFNAIHASTELALERGKYETFEGSLWSQGILPIDSIGLLKKVRGEYLDMDTKSTLNWTWLREAVVQLGMRNSNCMAVAPTATISNICGVSQSIEPMFQNLFVKTNLSGDFTVINPYLIKDLKALGLWDSRMMNILKETDGSIQNIDGIPNNIKSLYKQSFEVDWKFVIESASRRQKWIDQSQSVNLYLPEPKGSVIDALFKTAWLKGLKTTYYLRTLGATHVQKNTVQKHPAICPIDDPECESCQ